jgi:L-ribulose-5-phosphate 3-epimerase
MDIAINVSALAAGTTPDQACRHAADAGFAGIELAVADEGWLTWQSDEAHCRALAEPIRAAGLAIVGLTTDYFWKTNYGSIDSRQRRAAYERTIRLLDIAAMLGTDAVAVIPAIVGRPGEASPRTSYGDALARSQEALAQLAFESEQRAIVLAVENAQNRFLLSPVEFRDWLDQINSPWVRAYLNVGCALAVGYPQDWADVLAGAIARVRATDYRLATAEVCMPGEGDVDWPAVIRALRETGYDGPLTYDGPGAPGEIARRMKQVLEL